jgi:predicted nucleic acid-binding protein
MDVYVDSSVVLRRVFAQGDALASWNAIDRPVSSELVRVECLRTIDRARFSLRLGDEIVAERRAALLASLATFNLVPLSAEVLARAGDPFPTSLATLDAIHLATALAVRDRFDRLRVATHDIELGLAAQSMGFEVDGLTS